ncbi:hypothetical protein FQN49_003621 [Arthroderma sp. PD_2]|nr:hypothetical protein FQN49_003621 [Arthroderma sp. PD_2]
MPVHRPRQAQRINQLFILISITVVFALYYLFFKSPPRDHAISSTRQQPQPDSRKIAKASKELVVASVKSDNISWIREEVPDWRAKVYVADAGDAGEASKSGLSIPVNKGREAMVYLTYIIDHYDKLPDYMIFMHGQRYQWHNDDPIYDGASIISKLRLESVSKAGYSPLRCSWVPGCPVELHPLNPVDEGPIVRKQTELAFATVFRTFFPGIQVPAEVGATCSSQFATTREQVMLRPKADYQRIRKWLVDTELPDDISGRIMEYMWHTLSQVFQLPVDSGWKCGGGHSNNE